MSVDNGSLKADAIFRLTTFMDSLDPKRQRILAYWIRDYVRFLEQEPNFNYSKLVRYKRGSIVKAHLGYRIGSEEGGLHYAVVLDIHNSPKSPTVTVIPLTSLKPSTDIQQLHPSKLFLGDEIYQALTKKLKSTQTEMLQMKSNLEAKISILEKNPLDSSSPDFNILLMERRSELVVLRQQLTLLATKEKYASKMETEISRMKRGSIALVGQVTTISKIRVYDPLYPSDTLTNLRLSDKALDQLDNKLKELFLKPE